MLRPKKKEVIIYNDGIFISNKEEKFGPRDRHTTERTLREHESRDGAIYHKPMNTKDWEQSTRIKEEA